MRLFAPVRSAAALVAMVALLSTIATASADDARWQPQQAPLMTRWADDVTPENVHREYPRPQLVRDRWTSLNGVWELAFAEPDDELPAGEELPERILVPFPVESALSGIREHSGRLWYRRTFEVPEGWLGGDNRLLLHFGAIDWHSKIYVNGRQVGEHRGGYDAFACDITEALTDEGPQELIVWVFDPTDAGYQPRGKQVNNPRGIWYTPSTGIWQSVWLEPVPSRRIEGLRLTPDPDRSRLIVEHDTAFVSRSHRVDVYVLEDGKEIAKASGMGKIEVPVPDFQWWTPDNPHLYDLRVVLRHFENADQVTDEVTSYFGMRKVEIGRDDAGVTRILLNGDFVFQVGPLDQGFWPDGLYTAPTDEALRYDVEVMKKLGFNMVRKHVKIEPARWYYWCDKLGLLVWQDMPNGDRHIGRDAPDLQRSEESSENFDRELTALVRGRYNHPSIVMWVPFNEGWGQFDSERIVNLVKRLDPTRLVNCASGWAIRPYGDIRDRHAYPGPAGIEPTDTQAAVLGEFGGIKLAVKGHAWSDEIWGYRTVESPEQLTQRYESLLRGVYELKGDPGLSGAVYTQITDVENEANGLLTYDRAIIKPDVDRVAAANHGLFPVVKTVVPDAREKRLTWSYTTEKPEGDWRAVDYDDSSWNRGPAGFGRENTPGAVVGTQWTTNDIWLRRKVDIPEEKAERLVLVVHHDEDAEVYINGVLAAEFSGYTTGYEPHPITKAARAAIRPEGNVIAVHCRQTRGGQYIDVGFAELVPVAP